MSEKPEKKDRESNTNQYAKYSGLAFQLFLSMVVAAYIGKWLDAKLELSNNYLTLAFVVLVFLGFMYKIVKELS